MATMATEANTVQVRLELKVGSEPISGCIAAPAVAARDFWGWLELISALEDVRSGTAGPPPEQQSESSDKVPGGGGT